MARDYLIDTNTLAYWFDQKCREHAPVKQRIEAFAKLGRQPTLFMSSVTIGEIEYGHHAQKRLPQRDLIQAQYWAFLDRALLPLGVGRSTGLEYGVLRAALFEKYAPKSDRAKRVEQLINPVTSKTLGIQENDLWIAAQAIEYDLTLVTHDAMEPIRKCADSRLYVEDWAI